LFQSPLAAFACAHAHALEANQRMGSRAGIAWQRRELFLLRARRAMAGRGIL